MTKQEVINWLEKEIEIHEEVGKEVFSADFNQFVRNLKGVLQFVKDCPYIAPPVIEVDDNE